MSDTSTQTPPAPPAPPVPAPPAPPSTPAPAAVQRPDGVSDAEWSALGDPGKTALVRERARATAAEQALARAAKPPIPPPAKEGEQPDIAALINAGIAQAIAPLLDRDAQREAIQAAEKIRNSVTTAATERFHDATDALAQVDLTTLTDGVGLPDQAKITAALDEILKRKPHLGRAVDDRRRAAPGGAVGGTGASASLDDRVKASLARMQAATNVKFAE